MRNPGKLFGKLWQWFRGIHFVKKILVGFALYLAILIPVLGIHYLFTDFGKDLREWRGPNSEQQAQIDQCMGLLSAFWDNEQNGIYSTGEEIMAQFPLTDGDFEWDLFNDAWSYSLDWPHYPTEDEILSYGDGGCSEHYFYTGP